MRIFGCSVVDIALLLNTLVEGIGGAITFGFPSLMPPPLGPKVAELAGSGPVGSWVLHIIQGSTASLALLSLLAEHAEFRVYVVISHRILLCF